MLIAVLLAVPSYAETLQSRQHVLEPLFDAPCARYQVPKVLPPLDHQYFGAGCTAQVEGGSHPVRSVGHALRTLV